ncbi:DUF5058 family protein [Eubacteriales bacterium OttesenSCG-928-K08]|nr:DUF5058 family protein [Eubacteriales bacterium OttesenSCG-928-K08]
MTAELGNIINSGAMWACAIFLVLLVLAQAVLYIRLAYKEAKTIGYDTANLRKSFRLGMITGFGPALTGVVAMVSMMTLIGSPITWMRLSIIGAVPTEMGVASVTAQSLGITLGGESVDIKVISLIYLMMAIAGTGWLLVTVILTPRMGELRERIGKKDSRWLIVFTAATTIGLFANLAAQQLTTGGFGAVAAAISGFGVMFFLHNIVGKKSKGIKNYALTISMVVGIVLGILLG